MKILVFGYGAVGSVLVKLLEKEESVDRIVSADISFKEEKKTGRMQYLNINLKSKSQILDMLNSEKPDLVINASSPNFNSEILNACTLAGVNYMDMAAVWDPNVDKNAPVPYVIEQLDYDIRFKDKNLVGLIEAGVSPGMTNLFVRECADEFDELEDVKIRLIDYSGSDELHFAWSKEALLDEINSKPLIYEDGKYKIMEPFTGVEEYQFPEPYGKRKVSLICQEEIGTLPLFLKFKSIDIKDFDNQVDIHKFLYELGIVSKKKIKYEGIEIAPFDFVNKILPDVSFDNQDPKFNEAQFAFAVDVTGKANNKNKRIRYFVLFPKQKDINKLDLNANFISYPTALSAKFFAMAVSKIKLNGIMPPEALDKEIRKFIISELKKTDKVVIKKETFE